MRKPFIAINTSVSHGTLNPEHLIPFFTQYIFEELRLTYDVVPHTVCKARIDVLHEKINYGDIDSVQDILDDLFDYLDSIAPEGTYFGAHIGDGSDFGFWEYDENDIL